jgi:hypothetical protein
LVYNGLFREMIGNGLDVSEILYELEVDYIQHVTFNQVQVIPNDKRQSRNVYRPELESR